MDKENARQRVFSGIQPSGTFTLGNYIGAIRNWPLLQDDYDCVYCVVDQHAITVKQDPATLRRRTYESAALLLASGIDPEKSILFIQSHNPVHSQLNWILRCNVQYGELTRMTQFKDKSRKHPDDVNGGLLTYPVLMAADILAYNAHGVPVGIDQKQHVELARNIAQRFNYRYGETFVLPEALIPEVGAKIMSLQEPTKKMSKSDENVNAFILLTDDRDTIVRKFKRAVTDSDNRVRFDPENKPGISNLIGIVNTLSGESIEDIEKRYEGVGYGVFKEEVGILVADKLAPLQDNYNRILSDKPYLEGVLRDGAQKAIRVSSRILSKVYRKVGFTQF